MLFSWLFGKRPTFSPADLLVIPSQYFSGRGLYSGYALSPEIAASIGEVKIHGDHSNPVTFAVYFFDNERKHLFTTKQYPTLPEAQTAMRELITICRNHAMGVPIKIVVHWPKAQAA